MEKSLKIKDKKKTFQEEVEDGKRYTMINQDDMEKETIPIEPNLLDFYEKSVNESYVKYLFLEKNGKQFSSVFLSRLLIFYIFIILSSFVNITCTVLAYERDDMSISGMYFHVTFNITNCLFLLPFLFLLKSTQTGLKVLKPYFLIYAIITNTYNILGQSKTLNFFLSTTSSYTLPLTLEILSLSFLLKSILFNSFSHFLLIHSIMLTQFICGVLIVPNGNTLEAFHSFTIIFLITAVLTMDSRHSELIQKQDFWLQYSFEKSYKSSFTMRDETEDATMQTETELLIKSCDKVKKTLKHACSMIFFKDIKENLKIASIRVEHIKQKLARTVMISEVKIEHQADMDPEDRQFISQNFIDISFINSPDFDRPASSELTVMELKEFPEVFPFSTYGLDQLQSILSQLGKNWSFDIWFIYDTTGQSVFMVGKYLFEKWQINSFLAQNSETTDEFFKALEAGYLKNPYHNACHAADVLHTQLFFIMQSSLSKILTQLDVTSCIIACLGHDIGHSALTNRFLVNSCDDLAITYNDSSVLENMHSARTFELLKSQKTSILNNLTSEDWIRSRKMIMEMILQTDMSKHFDLLGRFRTRVTTLSNIDLNIFEDKCQVLGMSLKCADIGHSAKDYELHEKWSLLVCEEFFRQGDIEKNKSLPVSMYCDRETTDVPKSQVGFIRNICLPLYETWCFYLNSAIVSETCIGQLKGNIEFWSQKKKRRATHVSVLGTKTLVEKFKRIQTSK
jgi:hypothetical protein